MPCTLRLQFQNARKFTRPWDAFLHNWHLCTPAVRLCTLPIHSHVQVPILMPVHHALGSTMAQPESSYTCCKALYISGTFTHTGTTSCVHKVVRSRTALYTKTMIPKTHMPVHQAMGSTLAQRAYLYTRCKALYISEN